MAPKNTTDNWESFFARTQSLPEKKHTESFLKWIPANGRILDYGCGTGRWAVAFSRDRPDLTIDVLDQHLDKALLIPTHWKGEKLHTDFNDFNPTKTYDGIWAFATLFFLPKKVLKQKMHALAGALNPGGVIQFTMVADCPAANSQKFTGMNKKEILSMLEKENFTLLSLKLNKSVEYGLIKRKIPTFYITARKTS
jgi:trans-aconitate methyltransferase